MQGVLTEEEAKLLLAASHRPSFALAVLSQLVAAAPLRDAQRIRCGGPRPCAGLPRCLGQRQLGARVHASQSALRWAFVCKERLPVCSAALSAVGPCTAHVCRHFPSALPPLPGGCPGCRLDENLTFFEGCVGTCERILRTPIPLRCAPAGRQSLQGAAASCCMALALGAMQPALLVLALQGCTPPPAVPPPALTLLRLVPADPMLAATPATPVASW